MAGNLERIKSNLDVTPLLDQIDSKPELFGEITERQTTPGTPHTDTETIFLRWCQSRSIDAAFTDLEAVDYPAMEELPEARPLIAEMVHAVGGHKLGRVIIVKLRPGGKIPRHIDEGAYADHYERFHLALQSEPGNVFRVESSPSAAANVHMRQGELWWFNHKKTHSVTNKSKDDRIHLIADMVAPKYRRERDEVPA